MNRRIALAGLTLAVLGGGLAVPALASTADSAHKVCVLGPTPVAPKQQGLCLWWDDPVPVGPLQ